MSQLESILLDHGRCPYHRGRPEEFPLAASLASHHCGDEISLFATSDGRILSEIWHMGQGCLVSQAAASYLCEWAESRPITQLMTTANVEFLVPFGPLTPMRRECALLSLKCLKKVLDQL